MLHLLYSRFWHKVLFDLGHVSTAEPFKRLINQGYIQAAAFQDEREIYVDAASVEGDAQSGFTFDGTPVTRSFGKMGKSLKNSVTPDDMYAAFGADTLRLYEMSMHPSPRTGRGRRDRLSVRSACSSASGETSSTSRPASLP